MKNIKIIVKVGKSPGKNIVILAGVHGDEVCGVIALNELIPSLKIERGRVTFIYANLEAQKQDKRFIEKNLNRCFLDEQPKDIYNSLEGKTARTIIPFLKEADVLLDLHSSKSSENEKFIICEENCLEIISCLSPKKVIIGIDSIQPGSTDGYMFIKNKPGICVECGLHKSKESIEVAKESILSILKKLNIIDGESKQFLSKELYRVISMYKNKNGSFRLARDFKDFKKIETKTLIGYDGDEEIFVETGDVVLFPHENEEIGKECFVVLRSYPWIFLSN